MKYRLLISLGVFALVGAGFYAGTRVERQRPVPAPPAKLMTELSFPATKLIPVKISKMMKLQPAVNRMELEGAIAKLKPQIEAYRVRLEQIEDEFESSLVPVLTGGQRTLYATAQERLAAGRPRFASLDPSPPLSTEEILLLQNRPSYSVVNMVVIDLKLEWLIEELILSSEQSVAVRILLNQRREKFLALVDATPPPSLMLSDLATVAQRLLEAESVESGK